MTDKPIRSISINAKCYEMATSAVELQNPFPADCEFTVKLVNFSEEEQEAAAAAAAEGAAAAAAAGGGAKSKQSKTTKKPAGGRTKVPKIDASMYPDSFGVDRKTIRCKKGDRAQLSVSYLPFTMGAHYARIIFEDPTLGQFVYELNGYSDYPAPMITSKFSVDVKAGRAVPCTVPAPP